MIIDIRIFSAANIGNYKLMFIETACIFDSDSRTDNYRKLRKLLRENDLKELAALFNTRLKPYTKLISNIKTIRNRVIAHKESGVDPKDLYKKHGIRPNQTGHPQITTCGCPILLALPNFNSLCQAG